MILALSGRLVDRPGTAEVRFPLANVANVGRAIKALFRNRHVTGLVSSAACGADLIALSEAGSLRLRRRVILPFGRAAFRETSVVSRPGEWGALYDRILDEVDNAGDLIVLQNEAGDRAYSAASDEILRQATALARDANEAAFAALVWDGAPRGEDDLTAEFGAKAARLGLPVMHLTTI